MLGRQPRLTARHPQVSRAHPGPVQEAELKRRQGNLKTQQLVGTLKQKRAQEITQLNEEAAGAAPAVKKAKWDFAEAAAMAPVNMSIPDSLEE